jgi:hypothetical protein
LSCGFILGVALPKVGDGQGCPTNAPGLLDVLFFIAVRKSGGASLDLHRLGSPRGGWRIDGPGRDVREHTRLPLHPDMGALAVGSSVDRIANLVHDGVADVVVTADKLALATGAVKEMHWIRDNVDPPVAPAHDATLRVADVQ